MVWFGKSETTQPLTTGQFRQVFHALLFTSIRVYRIHHEATLYTGSASHPTVATFQFLQWYVSEQHEEERLFKSILDKIDVIGLDGKGIYFLDKEIRKLAGQTTV